MSWAPFAALAALAIGAGAMLRAWRDWLELKRLELGQGGRGVAAGCPIEIADLKERVRKLEMIAAGIDCDWPPRADFNSRPAS